MRSLLALLALLTLAAPARATTIEGLTPSGAMRSVNVSTIGATTYLNVAVATGLGSVPVTISTASPLSVVVASSSCPNISVSTGQVLSVTTQILPASLSRCGCLLSNDSDTKGFSGYFTVGVTGAPLGLGQAVRAGQSLSIDATPGVYTGALFAISNTTATYSSLCTTP